MQLQCQDLAILIFVSTSTSIWMKLIIDRNVIQLYRVSEPNIRSSRGNTISDPHISVLIPLSIFNMVADEPASWESLHSDHTKYISLMHTRVIGHRCDKSFDFRVFLTSTYAKLPPKLNKSRYETLVLDASRTYYTETSYQCRNPTIHYLKHFWHIVNGDLSPWGQI